MRDRVCESRYEGKCRQSAEWLHHGTKQPWESVRLTLYLCDEHAQRHSNSRPILVGRHQVLRPGIRHPGITDLTYLVPAYG